MKSQLRCLFRFTTLSSAADPILNERDGEKPLIVPDSKAGRLVFIPLSP